MRIVEVYIEHPVMKLDRTFSYVFFGENYLEKGMRVIVEFNRQQLVGFVDSVHTTDLSKEQLQLQLGYQLKEIDAVVDSQKIINDELFDLAKWMSYHTVSSTISCFQAMLPAKIKPKSTNEKIKMEKMVRILKEGDFTQKQKDAFEFLKNAEIMKKSDFTKLFNSVVNTLIKKGNIEEFEQEVSYKQTSAFIKDIPKKLTDLQQKAIYEIENSKDEIFLLHGVTGSGKTEIFLQLAQKCIDQNKEVLILVPEISLTPQMVERVVHRFGNQVAIYHSRLNNQEKYEQFKRVANKEVKIIVGTRSAIFMPFENIGLIILDEEHDFSYKQDSTPRYHTKDIAFYRAKKHNAKVVLASATPSVDSYARAIKKVYHLVELNQRVNQKQLPVCTVVNTKEAMKKGQSNILTNELFEKIRKRIELKQKVIILINKRGYHTVLRCKSCLEVVMCTNCDVAMSYHKEGNNLKCHICGSIQHLNNGCPKCHHPSFSYSGFGTQKVMEQLQQIFPEVKIVRMDSDTVSKKGGHQILLDEFKKEESSILIGTQMIAKGLDFPTVTLVGVIQADAMLTRTDYRSVESTFNLITQASGRSGRADVEGEVLIQVFEPNHYAIIAAAKQDYRMFFEKEMQYRHIGDYPPYCFMIALTFSHMKNHECELQCIKMVEKLKKHSGIKVLGPSELIRKKERYRYRVLIKGKNLDNMLKLVHIEHKKFMEEKSTVQLFVDVNPLVLD